MEEIERECAYGIASFQYHVFLADFYHHNQWKLSKLSWGNPNLALLTWNPVLLRRINPSFNRRAPYRGNPNLALLTWNPVLLRRINPSFNRRAPYRGNPNLVLLTWNPLLLLKENQSFIQQKSPIVISNPKVPKKKLFRSGNLVITTIFRTRN